MASGWRRPWVPSRTRWRDAFTGDLCKLGLTITDADHRPGLAEGEQPRPYVQLYAPSAHKDRVSDILWCLRYTDLFSIIFTQCS